MVFPFCFSYGSSGTISGGSSNYDNSNDESSNDDSYTDDFSSSGLSVAVIIGIVIGGIVFAAVMVTICVAFIYGCSKTGQSGNVITPVQAAQGMDKFLRSVMDVRLLGHVCYFTINWDNFVTFLVPLTTKPFRKGSTLNMIAPRVLFFRSCPPWREEADKLNPDIKFTFLTCLVTLKNIPHRFWNWLYHIFSVGLIRFTNDLQYVLVYRKITWYLKSNIIAYYECNRLSFYIFSVQMVSADVTPMTHPQPYSHTVHTGHPVYNQSLPGTVTTGDTAC